MVKLKIDKLENTDKDAFDQFIQKLKNNEFTMLAGEPFSDEEIERMEKEYENLKKASKERNKISAKTLHTQFGEKEAEE